MTSSSAMVGGIAYGLAGGSFDARELDGAAATRAARRATDRRRRRREPPGQRPARRRGHPLSAGVPLQLQLRRHAHGSGPTQFAYGIIAFLVVIMWLPGELGPVAVLVALAPLAGARWALLQYGEERDARERALGALVTAIETRAPALEGHSGRVSAMAALMAQELGLGPKEVADVRTAGLLHDLGRVVVAPGQEGTDQAGSAALRGAAMLQSLPFLAGASSVMEEVARADAVRSRTLPRGRHRAGCRRVRPHAPWREPISPSTPSHALRARRPPQRRGRPGAGRAVTGGSPPRRLRRGQVTAS